MSPNIFLEDKTNSPVEGSSKLNGYNHIDHQNMNTTTTTTTSTNGSHNTIFNDVNYLKILNVIKDMKLKGTEESDPQYITLLQIAKLYQIQYNKNNNSSSNDDVMQLDNGISNNNNNSEEEKDIFRAQLESYKYLSRSLPIPPKLLSTISSVLEYDQDKDTTTTETPIQQTQKTKDNNEEEEESQQLEENNMKLRYYPRGVLKLDSENNVIINDYGMGFLQQQQHLYLQQQQHHMFQEQYLDEQQQQQQQQLLQQKKHQSQQEKPNVKGLQESLVSIDERDLRMHTKIHYRIDELKEMPLNHLPVEMKLKAQIEMKQLRLVDLQRKLRIDIAGEINNQIFLDSALETDLLVKPIPRVVSKPTEIMYDNTATQLPESILVTHKHKFLEAVLAHQKQFKDYHTDNAKSRNFVVKQIARYHKEREKREQERLKKERIRLLRAQDTQGYRDLLAKTKNDRLEMLLGQTDELLSSINNLMKKEEIEKKEREKERERERLEKEKLEKERLEKERLEKEKLGIVDDESNITDKSTTSNNTTTTTTTTTSPIPNPIPIQPIANISSSLTSTTTLIQKKSLLDEPIEQPEIMTGGKLKEYQLTGLEWLVSLYNRNLNGILADEMGLGKTVQSIAFISYLYEKLNVREPFLVVAPLSTISNWSSEFARWSPKLPTIIYKGKPDERYEQARQIPKNGFVVVITSFEYIILDKKRLGRVQWCYIIVDEGHRIKNKDSKLSVQLRLYHSKHRLLLTGTPLQNELGELWALLNFLLPTIFNSLDTFENWFNAPFAGAKGGKSVIQVNEEESLIIINRLHQVLRFFLLRRLKSDVESQLPDKKEKVIKCNLSAMQIVMYRTLLEHQVLLIDPESETFKKNKMKRRGFNNIVKQLQKICNHPYLFKDEWAIDQDLIRASGKFDTMDQILMKMRASGHRVLIFTQMTEVINLMEEYFSLKEWDYLRLDGSTKPDERSHLVVEWNRPDSPHWIFVLSTHAGGLGMNLQTADTVIIFDSDWNPQMDLQAQDRCHRIGQTNSVSVFRLISANSIEEQILARATDKLEIDAKIIQAGMFNTHSNDQERRAKLEEYLHGFPRDTTEEAPTDLEEINRLICRDDEEFAQFQEMDKEKAKIDKQLYKNKVPSRLITEAELPAWMLESPIEEEEDTTFGKKRAAAISAANNPVDDLTELQYAKMVEKGMSLEEYKKYLVDKREKRNGGGNDQFSSDDDEDEDIEDESSEDEKKKKKKKKIVIKNSSSSSSTPKRVRGGASKKAAATPSKLNGNSTDQETTTTTQDGQEGDQVDVGGVDINTTTASGDEAMDSSVNGVNDDTGDETKTSKQRGRKKARVTGGSDEYISALPVHSNEPMTTRSGRKLRTVQH
ncbi:hypothetical protein CYY_003906 [Polysphondylium violaceum]|uniref:SNF2-related domain-containing protein n=1 Tax=Polysphondylium violaceum TaxID=133409 RepID=A0A8J4V0T3_9MYCE|nr:hypothetical protein CYY_003906 [Polysphondylium violaceum]